jgi:hypothetical protein
MGCMRNTRLPLFCWDLRIQTVTTARAIRGSFLEPGGAHLKPWELPSTKP